ncbi:helix-turn-helix domain-containing protein [Paenibacillus alkaliterrae]|uniref:helix-turn-helix domain-containing protein n=1 Tax=Paenibacillus alkaliterrae TaxID=320909 RepID=UPI001F3B20E5|nr:helix-turn-helix transcriptional regulator [Paenibacillus alkaliterrae]MCF2937429.1 helix-turn-helix domain-containing protein [Paenibacillus alkaliterrae]
MIGERIKSLREKKGYSITKLADLAGVSKSYLSYIERNMQNNPSLKVMAKIAAPLDSNIEYLLGEEHLPKIYEDEILDDEWRSIIKKAVDEGMSKGDFQALKDLVRSNMWKESLQDAAVSSNEKKKTSNIIILHIDN